MNGGKITIEVGLGVSDDDAAACVLLLQLYLKNHPEKYIEFTTNTDGDTQIQIMDKREGGGIYGETEYHSEAEQPEFGVPTEMALKHIEEAMMKNFP